MAQMIEVGLELLKINSQKNTIEVTQKTKDWIGLSRHNQQPMVNFNH